MRGKPLDSDVTYRGIAEPATLDERIGLAKAWHEKSGLTHDLLVDDTTNAMCSLFAARPERLYILKEGIVLYQGGEGPFNYSVDDCMANLDRILLNGAREEES
mmetsp:Transcript_1121/g.3226  ORF Transcript_1121/g.3226 Transcript_1121/m.3226 type:complete len:103 (+) Transcript_1121:393-701(+)